SRAFSLARAARSAAPAAFSAAAAALSAAVVVLSTSSRRLVLWVLVTCSSILLIRAPWARASLTCFRWPDQMRYIGRTNRTRTSTMSHAHHGVPWGASCCMSVCAYLLHSVAWGFCRSSPRLPSGSDGLGHCLHDCDGDPVRARPEQGDDILRVRRRGQHDVRVVEDASPHEVERARTRAVLVQDEGERAAVRGR